MEAQLSRLIAMHQQHLDELRTEAESIAAVIADDVWDRLEIDIEEAAEAGFNLQFANLICSALSQNLAAAYEASIERHVLADYERQSKEMARRHGHEGIDTATLYLTGLRKEQKLRRHAWEMIGQAIEKAQPGVDRVLGVVISNLFRDPMGHLDTLEKHMNEDTIRLRRQLLALRDPVRQLVAQESLATIQSTRVEFSRLTRQWLGGLSATEPQAEPQFELQTNPGLNQAPASTAPKNPDEDIA